MASLLEPGSHRAAGVVDDDALVAAMVRVEEAWLRVRGLSGSVEKPVVLDLAEAESGGNPVLPLVQALRADLGVEVHRGLTSQDVLDTALMLLARDAVARIVDNLTRVADSLAGLASEHRGSVMVGRTLTQYAVPVTFGLKAAQWLTGVLDARAAAGAVVLPVQCGGAAGTLALAGELVADPVEAARAFADELGLAAPSLSWHTRRTPVTRLGDALVETCDALGHIAGDVLALGRPEVAEVREGAAGGRGGSSTMPHKQNPVLSVLVRSAALQAPQLGAQLHVCAAESQDERSPGAWHAEWPALRRLLELTMTASSQAAELVAGLEVDTAAMRRRAESAARDLLSERGSGDAASDDPASYLGASDVLIDAALARWTSRG
ncbi:MULTISPECIES: lyase family protein [unclassified Kribbella]|uniref:lyase family protein n=1 Tax=unclassified Kribbella TaxID=2644121 RepID=UPI0030783798